MSGGRSPKRKGVRVERELVQQLLELGLTCARVPLSGAIGGAWSRDIELELLSRICKAEVKARRQFNTLHEWISGADLLTADRQPPRVVLPVPLFAELACAAARKSELRS